MLISRSWFNRQIKWRPEHFQATILSVAGIICTWVLADTAGAMSMSLPKHGVNLAVVAYQLVSWLMEVSMLITGIAFLGALLEIALLIRTQAKRIPKLLPRLRFSTLGIIIVVLLVIILGTTTTLAWIQLRTANNVITALQTQNQNLQDQNSSLQSSNNDLKSRMQDLNSQIIDLQGQLDTQTTSAPVSNCGNGPSISDPNWQTDWNKYISCLKS